MFATLQAKLIVAGVSLALAFGGGWLVKSKFVRAAEASELRAMIDAQNKEVERLRQFNDRTATREKEILAQIGAINSALDRINDEISRTDVGVCSITPAGDELRQRAFDQATAP